MTLLVVSLTITFAAVSRVCQCRCLPLSADSIERHFYLDGQDLNITIDASSRDSHLLVSHLLRLLLAERIGYTKAQVVTPGNDDLFLAHGTEPESSLRRLAGCDNHRTCRFRTKVPKVMINLEVWLRAGFNLENWTRVGFVADAGPLGPSGRFGWFIPANLTEKRWRERRQIIDHWRSLTKEEIVELFQLEEEKKDLMRLLTSKSPTSPSNSERYCQPPICDSNGFWTSEHCRKHRCATLLSSYPEVDNGALIGLIRTLNLPVKVAWIGPHLEQFVLQRAAKDKAVLFYNWTPNSIAVTANFTRVKFPSCVTSACDFEAHQMTKVTWTKLEEHQPEIHKLISRIRFSDEEYKNLLQIYMQEKEKPHSAFSAGNDQRRYEAAACRWLKANVRVWRHWIPPGLTSRIKITLGGMFPISGPYFRAPGIIPGAQLALDRINNDSTVLPGYKLIMAIRDTQCKSDVVVTQFMKFLTNDTYKIAGILGPGCSDTSEPLAGVAKHFNMVMISYSEEAVQLSSRAIYPLFFRMVQTAQHGRVFLDLFSKFDWQQVALLAEDATGQEFPEYHAFLQELFSKNEIKVVYHRKMPLRTTPADAKRYVDDIRTKKVRIIILSSYEMSSRAILCEAYKQGMTGYQGYQWFLPAWFTQKWWDTDRFNQMKDMKDVSIESVPCSTDDMQHAIQGHMALTNAIHGQLDSHIVGNLSVKQWLTDYRAILDEWVSNSVDIVNNSCLFALDPIICSVQFRKTLRSGITENAYASYAYDATWTFALGLHKLLREDPSALASLHSKKTTQKLVRHLKETRFIGASGPVRFVGADRAGIVNVDQYIRYSYRKVAQYLPNQNASNRLILNTSLLTWVSGQRPLDGRAAVRCSVESFRRLLGVSCDTAVVIANILGVGLFALLMIISLIVVKKRYDDKVRATRMRIEELGLVSYLSLDQWEIPRDHVVLNRKLGEGAFGTVYGGEALVNDKWQGVAVKTLKVGSNAEEKLDFLFEAEMMKGFDHGNIVKLLGVVTRGEPALAIMEFMLHGDLKTFLLARRQLVGSGDSQEAEDAKPSRLTSMALDVSLGLKYLTDLKYVHRDLACRNCLIDFRNKVKIGDFGMTRRVYESEYYRFNKRGMLPVRWMAPESLSDGVFTSASDVWSFGILLYEIVTFGSFPYQGLSNKQVLEYVKNCNTIVLPDGCKQELRELLQSCWAYEPDVRPNVEQLIEELTKQEELLVPCMDEPASAVQFENTDSSLELFTIPSSSSSKPRYRTSAGRFSSSSNEASHHTVRPSASCERSFSQFSSQRSPSPSSATMKNDPFNLISSRDNVAKCRVVMNSASRENISATAVRRESLHEQLKAFAAPLLTSSATGRDVINSCREGIREELRPLTAKLSLGSRQSSEDRTESTCTPGAAVPVDSGIPSDLSLPEDCCALLSNSANSRELDDSCIVATPNGCCVRADRENGHLPRDRSFDQSRRHLLDKEATAGLGNCVFSSDVTRPTTRTSLL